MAKMGDFVKYVNDRGIARMALVNESYDTVVPAVLDENGKETSKEYAVETCTLHVFLLPGDVTGVVTSEGPRLLDVRSGVQRSDEAIANTWHE